MTHASWRIIGEPENFWIKTICFLIDYGEPLVILRYKQDTRMYVLPNILCWAHNLSVPQRIVAVMLKIYRTS